MDQHGNNFDPDELTVFNNALWFNGSNAGQTQLYKLGADGSVTKWTAHPGMGFGLEPFDKTVFQRCIVVYRRNSHPRLSAV